MKIVLIYNMLLLKGHLIIYSYLKIAVSYTPLKLYNWWEV